MSSIQKHRKIDIIQPSYTNSITLLINSNNLEKKQSRLKTELNKQIEVMRRKNLAAEHLAKYPRVNFNYKYSFNL